LAWRSLAVVIPKIFMKTVFGGLGFMIHQQVHEKNMIVWVYVFLSPGITCSLAQA